VTAGTPGAGPPGGREAADLEGGARGPFAHFAVNRHFPAGIVPGVQTFLPYPSFEATAEVLDRARLGKQRVEALQILRALTVPGYGWQHHPAVAMWAGYEEALACYGLTICATWTAAGRKDTCAATIQTDFEAATHRRLIRSWSALRTAGELPPWLGDPDFHRAHQSALLRKNREYYLRYFPDVPDDLPYVWPESDRPRTRLRHDRAR
jgi:hypothetical protein